MENKMSYENKYSQKSRENSQGYGPASFRTNYSILSDFKGDYENSQENKFHMRLDL
jgi:hypothetical protein